MPHSATAKVGNIAEASSPAELMADMYSESDSDSDNSVDYGNCAD